MGVDYFVCSCCNTTFPDCGEYFTCTVCERMYCGVCGEKEVDKYGCGDPPEGKEGWYPDNDPDGCYQCDPKNVNDDDLLLYLIEKSGKTVEELKAQVIEERNNE